MYAIVSGHPPRTLFSVGSQALRGLWWAPTRGLLSEEGGCASADTATNTHRSAIVVCGAATAFAKTIGRGVKAAAGGSLPQLPCRRRRDDGGRSGTVASSGMSPTAEPGRHHGPI